MTASGEFQPFPPSIHERLPWMDLPFIMLATNGAARSFSCIREVGVERRDWGVGFVDGRLLGQVLWQFRIR